ncbi:unnamed protein product [Dovyalis caffra]|uniref:Uncharacterized protein n=1 Tax=Dovyalis caffra TaxID=77055 RepID=A0AAV1RW41_9ROSI|nr:unnamed protein product [Dovyalis caffra]
MESKSLGYSGSLLGTHIPNIFYTKACQRRKTNFIHGLFDNHGSWRHDHQDVVDVGVSDFTSICTSSKSPNVAQSRRHLPRGLPRRMNISLTRRVTKAEINKADFAIQPTKALRNDGMAGKFFKLIGL